MYLGEIIVPTDTPDWVPRITYRPDPPIVVRGAYDPYNAERKRAVWIAEEAAWKKIVPLQVRYAALKQNEANTMRLIQHWIKDIETLTGKKSGMADAANYATLLYSISGGPYAWVAAIGKLGVDMILGMGKKKQLKSIMNKLEMLGREMENIQAQLLQVTNELKPLVAVGHALKAEQQVIMTADTARAGEQYQQRLIAQSIAGKQHAQRALLYERLSPSRQGAFNAL